MPARTSPLPAVASQGVATGSSMSNSSFATYVTEPLSKTVTPRMCAALRTHLLGSPSMASVETGTPRAVRRADSSPLWGVISVGWSSEPVKFSDPASRTVGTFCLRANTNQRWRSHVVISEYLFAGIPEPISHGRFHCAHLRVRQQHHHRDGHQLHFRICVHRKSGRDAQRRN